MRQGIFGVIDFRGSAESSDNLANKVAAFLQID